VSEVRFRDAALILSPLLLVAAYLAALLYVTNPARAQEQPPSYSAVVKVEHQETYDTKGIQFYSFVGPDGKDSSLLSVDGDLELSKLLLMNDRKHIRITIESAEPQELTK